MTNDRFDLALARVRSEERVANRQLKAMTVASAESADDIARLQGKITSLEAQAPSTPWMLHLLFFLCGAAAVLVARRSRPRVSRTPPEAPITRVPDDARELISTR